MKKLLSKTLLLLNLINMLPLTSDAIYREKNYENTRMKQSCSLCRVSNRSISEKEYDKLMDEVINDIISEVLRNWVITKRGNLNDKNWNEEMQNLTRKKLESKDDLLDGYSIDETQKISEFMMSEELFGCFKNFILTTNKIAKYKQDKFIKIIEIWARAITKKDAKGYYKTIKLTNQEYNDTLLDKDEIVEFIKIFVEMFRKKFKNKSKIKTPSSLISKKICEYLKGLPQFRNVDFVKILKEIYPNYENTLHLHYWWKVLYDDAERLGVRGVCRHRAPWLSYKISKRLGGNVAILTCRDNEYIKNSDLRELNHMCTLAQVETKDGEKKWFVADPQRLTDLALGTVSSYFTSYGKLPTIEQCKKFMDKGAYSSELGKVANNGVIGLLKCPFRKFVSSRQLFSGYAYVYSAQLTPILENFTDFVSSKNVKKINEYSFMLK